MPYPLREVGEQRVGDFMSHGVPDPGWTLLRVVLDGRPAPSPG